MATYQTVETSKGEKRYRAIVRMRGAPTISKTFRKAGEEKKWAIEMEARIQRGGNVNFNDLRNTTVADVLRKYQQEVTAGRDSWRFEHNRIENYLRQPWSLLDLNADIAGALRAWRDKRLTEVKPASVVRDFGVLGSVFRHAMTEWGLPMQSNPAHMVKKPKVQGDERSRLWTDKDIEIWMNYFQFDQTLAPQTKSSFVPWVMAIGRATGLRLGEVCRIEISNIDLSVPQIYFPKTKNGDEFYCPLRSDAVAIVRQLMEHRRGEEKLIGATEWTIGEMFRRARKVIAKQFPDQHDILLHSLRHTYTTEMVARVPDKLALMRMTGRRTLQSLARYYKPGAGDLAKMMG